MQSHFLDSSSTKASDTSFKRFRLCLQRDIYFSDGSRILTKHLARAISETHLFIRELPALNDLEETEDCVRVSLKSADRLYFHKLTNYRSTVLKSPVDESISVPVGLGAFTVTSFTELSLLLKNRDPQARNIDKIDFIRYDKLAKSETHSLNDWNYVYHVDIPKSVKSRMMPFKRHIAKSYSLFIRFEDFQVRRELAGCLNSAEIAERLEIPLTPLPGLIPRGIEGWNVALDVNHLLEGNTAKCSAIRNLGEINFYAVGKASTKELKEYFSSRKLAGRAVNVKDIGPDLLKILKGKEEFITIVGHTGSSSFNADGFMRAYLPGSEIVPWPIESLRDYERNHLSSGNISKIKEQTRRWHKLVLDTGLVVPLGQYSPTFYHESWVDETAWIDASRGIPDFSKFLIGSRL